MVLTFKLMNLLCMGKNKTVRYFNRTYRGIFAVRSKTQLLQVNWHFIKLEIN